MTSNENGKESVVDRMAGILEPETSQEQPKVQEEQPEVQQETEQPIDEIAQEETQESTALIDETVEENEITEQEVEQPQTYRVYTQHYFLHGGKPLIQQHHQRIWIGILLYSLCKYLVYC